MFHGGTGASSENALLDADELEDSLAEKRRHRKLDKIYHNLKFGKKLKTRITKLHARQMFCEDGFHLYFIFLACKPCFA